MSDTQYEEEENLAQDLGGYIWRPLNTMLLELSLSPNRQRDRREEVQNIRGAEIHLQNIF
jgi:hypothetical protein